MAEYTNEYANFPQSLITKHSFKDVTDDIASLINQINSLRTKGLYGQAERLIEQNEDILGQYVIDSTVINTIIEELRNAQIYAKQAKQYVFTGEEMPVCEYNDVWIGGV